MLNDAKSFESDCTSHTDIRWLEYCFFLLNCLFVTIKSLHEVNRVCAADSQTIMCIVEPYIHFTLTPMDVSLVCILDSFSSNINISILFLFGFPSFTDKRFLKANKKIMYTN